MSALQEAIELRARLVADLTGVTYVTSGAAGNAADMLIRKGWVTAEQGAPDAEQGQDSPSGPTEMEPPARIEVAAALETVPDGVVYVDRDGYEFLQYQGAWYCKTVTPARNYLPLTRKP